MELIGLTLALAFVPVQQARTTPRPQKLFEWTRLRFEKREYAARRARLVVRLKATGGGIYLAPSATGISGGETFRQLDDFLYFTGLELPSSVLAIDSASGAAMLFVPGNDRRFANPARRNDFPGRRLGADPELAARSGIADVRAFSALPRVLAEWRAAGRHLRVRPSRRGPVRVAALSPTSTDSATERLVRWIAAEQPQLRIESAFAEVASLRMKKSAREIEVIGKACVITARSMREAARQVADGVCERMLEGVLEAGFKKRGAQRVAFASIIKSGPNSLWPWRILAAHYDRRNRSMKAGELVIFDVGCELDHYASDVGRTFPVSGKFTKRQRELVRMVTAASDAVIAAVEPGVTLGELQRVALAKIPKAERRFMQAGLYFGHHIGLDVGDPSLAGAKLEAGMVFTVEPWYYNHAEGVAVFIEDDIVVTDHGAINLTASLPRRPEQLEQLVGNRPPPPPGRGYDIPLIDLAAETDRQVVVDREKGQYLGHPTTVLLEDGKTMICVYPKGHGRGGIVMKRSEDGGRTWSKRLPTPASWATSKEVPTIYRVTDKHGTKRLVLFSGLYPIRMSVSEDDGATWSELEKIGDFGGIVAMGCVIPLKNGDYLALFHDDGRFIGPKRRNQARMLVYKTVSHDGGLTWGAPEVIASHPVARLCEPGYVRSPDGAEIAVLLRENARSLNSHVIFSRDEGKTWTAPRALPAALTGDRHVARYAPDGRLFITFRDTTLESPTKGDWVAWVGTYDDIVNGLEGRYRVRLMDNKHRWDCAYPGLELLPDGTFVTTTYGHWVEGEPPYIVSVRLRLDELDARARR